jgi:hypothetical protein
MWISPVLVIPGEKALGCHSGSCQHKIQFSGGASRAARHISINTYIYINTKYHKLARDRFAGRNPQFLIYS